MHIYHESDTEEHISSFTANSNSFIQGNADYKSLELFKVVLCPFSVDVMAMPAQLIVT